MRTWRQRALAAGMLLAAVGLLQVEVAVVDPARTWVWVERLFWHPLAAWCLATVLAVGASWIGLRSDRWTV